MTTDTTEPRETTAPTPVTSDRWFLSDCEGQLVILRENKLRNVTRDERGEITGYRLPAEWGPDVVIAEWDLNTWDEGDDESDDLRRKVAARIVADHNEVERLRAELDRAEAVCLMLGWTGSVLDTDRTKALHQLWSRWVRTKPVSFMAPAAHPELSDEVIERLARERDEIRERTLAAIRGDGAETGQ